MRGVKCILILQRRAIIFVVVVMKNTYEQKKTFKKIHKSIDRLESEYGRHFRRIIFRNSVPLKK